MHGRRVWAALESVVPGLGIGSLPLGIGLFWFCVLAQAQQGQVPSVRPNVLLIVLDDVGREKLGFCGVGLPAVPTPNLDSLRQQGILFDNVRVQPLCSPTRAAILTGRRAFRTGMGHITNDAYVLPQAEITLAEALKAGFPGIAKPYRCGIFGKWHLTSAPDYRHAIEQGFDYFLGSLENVPSHYQWSQVRADSASTVVQAIGTEQGPWDETTFSASVATAGALAWIQEQKGPFFASVCYNAPHTPFEVPPLNLLSTATQAEVLALGYGPGQDLTQTDSARRAFDWLIEAIDSEIGKLLAGIPAAKLQKTLIFVISDNGTPRGVVQDPPLDKDKAKGTVYELGTHVPLLVSGALINQPNSNCPVLVEATDLWRTLLELTGARVPLIGGEDSLSFAAQVYDPTLPGTRTLAFVQNFKPNGPYTPDPMNPPAGLLAHDRGITDGHYKYVRRKVFPPLFYKEEAYDLWSDPAEALDLWPIVPMLPESDRLAILSLREELLQMSGY